MNRADKAEILTRLTKYVSMEWLTPKQAELLTEYYGAI